MIEVTLVGGPCDGDGVKIKADQLEVQKDGCLYRHQEATGFYEYVESGTAPKPAARFRSARSLTERGR